MHNLQTIWLSNASKADRQICKALMVTKFSMFVQLSVGSGYREKGDRLTDRLREGHPREVAAKRSSIELKKID
ncbi:hypothetical protein KIN20_010139 [Parelaphostrongylus tenuis]|uniref:Uncharacterized protein n=1 Tax=Parelaphostrongylus tenuis TaxID=148309 RepID=A0AAD5QL72_PARTN|nr:hypothetical protein KIN20_010139 [Parelaphostrongylus tenuis]